MPREYGKRPPLQTSTFFLPAYGHTNLSPYVVCPSPSRPPPLHYLPNNQGHLKMFLVPPGARHVIIQENEASPQVLGECSRIITNHYALGNYAP